jgi:hypothetical protein
MLLLGRDTAREWAFGHFFQELNKRKRWAASRPSVMQSLSFTIFLEASFE